MSVSCPHCNRQVEIVLLDHPAANANALDFRYISYPTTPLMRFVPLFVHAAAEVSLKLDIVALPEPITNKAGVVNVAELFVAIPDE